jgi:hypothetical protein
VDKLLEVRGTVTVTDRWYRDIREKKRKRRKKVKLSPVLACSEGKESNNMNEKRK